MRGRGPFFPSPGWWIGNKQFFNIELILISMSNIFDMQVKVQTFLQ